MNRLKIALAIGLGAFLMLFALQNMAQVELTILLWTFEARRIVVIALSFIVGLVLGLMIKGARSKEKQESPETKSIHTRW